MDSILKIYYISFILLEVYSHAAQIIQKKIS